MFRTRSSRALVVAVVWLVGAAGWGGWLTYRHGQPAALSQSASDRSALAAGRQFAIDVFSYDKSTFDADFDRALAETTGDLTVQVQSTKQAVQASLASGTVIATSAEIKAAGVESSDGATVRLLVVAETYSVDPASQSTATGQQRLSVTMVQRGRVWLASSMTVVSYQ